jgi:hypothetical protein
VRLRHNGLWQPAQSADLVSPRPVDPRPRPSGSPSGVSAWDKKTLVPGGRTTIWRQNAKGSKTGGRQTRESGLIQRAAYSTLKALRGIQIAAWKRRNAWTSDRSPIGQLFEGTRGRPRANAPSSRSADPRATTGARGTRGRTIPENPPRKQGFERPWSIWKDFRVLPMMRRWRRPPYR